MHLPLTALRNSETGIIISTDTSSKHGLGRYKIGKGWRRNIIGDRFNKRLNDLGLTPGTKVTVVKSAPFNGPLEVFVRGSRLAIGRGMASRILVDVKR